MMVVRANTMVYEAASPQLTQALLDLINKRITPVVQSRGSPGEGDLPQMGNVGGTMVGVGEAYYNGQRMSAARRSPGRAAADRAVRRGRRRAGQHERVHGGPGGAARARHEADARLGGAVVRDEHAGHELERHAHRVHAQQSRPFPFQNQSAARTLRADRRQLPVRLGRTGTGSSRTRRACASSQRNGSAWEALQRLKRNTLIQINSSDHNPAVAPGVSPASWELATPWFMQYHVAGGPNNRAGGLHPLQRQLRRSA